MHFLRAVSSKKKKQRDAALEKASSRQIGSLRNISHDICCGQIQFPKRIRKKLMKYKRVIRDLSKKSKLRSLRAIKKRLTSQEGGWLPAALPFILSLLSGVGQKLLDRAIPK